MNVTSRLLGIFVATALLTIGLYFLLYVFAPLVAGLVAGFFLAEKKKGTIAAFLGSFTGSLSLQIVTIDGVIAYLISEGIILPPPTSQDFFLVIISMIVASLILAGIGAIGGYIGSHVSTMSNPGS